MSNRRRPRALTRAVEAAGAWMLGMGPDAALWHAYDLAEGRRPRRQCPVDPPLRVREVLEFLDAALNAATVSPTADEWLPQGVS